MPADEAIRFSSALPIIVYTRPAGRTDLDWHEEDQGPGYFSIAEGNEVGIRIKSIDDAVLKDVVEELQELAELRYLNLSENRNITNEGMKYLRSLPQLRTLNLSSCSISSKGLIPLKDLPHLERLILSYCNRLSDPALKTLEAMRQLEYVDLQGCLGFTHASFARVRRKKLTIFR